MEEVSLVLVLFSVLQYSLATRWQCIGHLQRVLLSLHQSGNIGHFGKFSYSVLCKRFIT